MQMKRLLAESILAIQVLKPVAEITSVNLKIDLRKVAEAFEFLRMTIETNCSVVLSGTALTEVLKFLMIMAIISVSGVVKIYLMILANIPRAEGAMRSLQAQRIIPGVQCAATSLITYFLTLSIAGIFMPKTCS